MKPTLVAREKVTVMDLAERLCAEQGKELRRTGTEFKANCLLPDHEDRTPSFTVNPEKNTWYCFGCVRGGGVLELARLVWSYDQQDEEMAAAHLLDKFGHQIPSRVPSWFRRQQRQKPVRDALEHAAIRRVQRRIFRWCFAPIIACIEDEEERAAEGRHGWEDAGLIARIMVAQARGEKR